MVWSLLYARQEETMNQHDKSISHPDEDLQQILQLQQRAMECAGSGMMDEALEAAMLSLGLLEERAPDRLLLKGKFMQNTSRILLFAKDLEQGEAIGTEGVDLFRSLADCPLEVLADGLLNLSSIQYAAKKFDDATVTLMESMALWKQAKGPKSDQVGDCLNNLGRIREQRGYYRDAVDFYEQVVDIKRSLYGDHEQTAFAMMSKGIALMESGAFKEANIVLQESVDCCTRVGIGSGQIANACAENLRVCRGRRS